jgi:hypothetical protein
MTAGSNPGRRCGKQATNCLSYGAALRLSNIGPKTKLWICKHVCVSKIGRVPGSYFTKLMIAQPVKKCPSFMKRKRSYPRSQQSEGNLSNGAATKNTLVIKLISGSKIILYRGNSTDFSGCDSSIRKRRGLEYLLGCHVTIWEHDKQYRTA